MIRDGLEVVLGGDAKDPRRTDGFVAGAGGGLAGGVAVVGVAAAGAEEEGWGGVGAVPAFWSGGGRHGDGRRRSRCCSLTMMDRRGERRFFCGNGYIFKIFSDFFYQSTI